MARDLYSRISDSELDRIVTSVQHEHPNSGYRMMQGYVARLGHRVQQTRIRESMARTDPDGVLSRWFTAVHRRSYYVSTPNALWHIDGHHRLIRYLLEGSRAMECYALDQEKCECIISESELATNGYVSLACRPFTRKSWVVVWWLTNTKPIPAAPIGAAVCHFMKNIIIR